jgi:hypothetical protein
MDDITAVPPNTPLQLANGTDGFRLNQSVCCAVRS